MHITTKTVWMSAGFGRLTTRRLRSIAVSLFVVLLSATACTKEPVSAADSTVPINSAEASIFAPDSSSALIAPEASLSTPDTSIPSVDASTTPDAATQQPESGAIGTDCLSCHGPFNVVQEASSAYITPQGIAVNPHTTLDTQNITSIMDNPHRPEAAPIECDICHPASPMPPPSVDAVPKANITQCYSCHHEQVFTPSCVECHEANGL
jgi:hypothetical protein